MIGILVRFLFLLIIMAVAVFFGYFLGFYKLIESPFMQDVYEELDVYSTSQFLDREKLLKWEQELDDREDTINRLRDQLFVQQNDLRALALELESQNQAQDLREEELLQESLRVQDENETLRRLGDFLSNMPPQDAVNILNTMSSQQASRLLTAYQNRVETEGLANLIPVWFSLMDPAKAADIQSIMLDD